MSAARRPAGQFVALAAGLGLIAGLVVSQQPLLAALAVAGAVGLAICLSNPSLLVVGMFLGILFDRLGATGAKIANLPVTASKISVLGSIGVWAIYAASSRVRPVRWHPVLSSMVAVVAVIAFGVALSGSMKEGRFTLFGMGMVTVLVGLVYAILADRPLQPLYRILGAALSAALVTSVLRAGGVGESGRASGTLGDPNEWATMVLLLGPFILGGLAEDRHWLARPLRLALIALVPLGVLLSGSRASVFVLLPVGAVCLHLLRRHRGEVLACGALAVLAMPFVGGLEFTFSRLKSLADNFQGGAAVPDRSFYERMELLRQGVELFHDNWLFGVGPGNFASATGFISEDGRLRPAHNTYLEIASEQGLIGLIVAAIFLLTVGLSLYRAYQGAHRERDRARILGLAAGLGAVALMAATLGLLTFSMAYLVLGFALAVMAQSRGDDVL
jgi:O-antigen ligase